MIKIEVEVLADGSLKLPDYNRCLRCGRLLKDKKARLIGYGPVCFDKIKKMQKNKLF